MTPPANRPRSFVLALAGAFLMLTAAACLGFNEDGRYLCDPSAGEACTPDSGTFVPPITTKDGGGDGGEISDGGGEDGGDGGDGGTDGGMTDAGVPCDGGVLGLCLVAKYDTKATGLHAPWSADNRTFWAATSDGLVGCGSGGCTETSVGSAASDLVDYGKGEAAFYFNGATGGGLGRITADGKVEVGNVSSVMYSAIYGSESGAIWIAMANVGSAPGIVQVSLDGGSVFEPVPNADPVVEIWGPRGDRARLAITRGPTSGFMLVYDPSKVAWQIVSPNGGVFVALSGTSQRPDFDAWAITSNAPWLYHFGKGVLAVDNAFTHDNGQTPTDIWIAPDGSTGWITATTRLYRRIGNTWAGDLPEALDGRILTGVYGLGDDRLLITARGPLQAPVPEAIFVFEVQKR